MCHAALQHAQATTGETCGMFARLDGAATGFDADQLDAGLVEVLKERSDGIRTTADARHDGVGQAVFGANHLLLRLNRNDAVEIANHHRVGMRTISRAQNIMRVAHIGHPIAHGLVDGLFQRSLTCFDATDLCAHEPHPINIQGLALHVRRTHVDNALKAETCADRGGGGAVLPGAGFGDDARLAHAHSE